MEGAQQSDAPRRSEEEQQAFFDKALALALKAEAITGARSHDLAVAGTTVRLVFAGPRLEELLLPAIAHLKIAAVDKPGATFHVWDSESSGIENVPPPCPWGCFTDRGDIWGFHSTKIRSAFHWIECTLNLMDMATNTGVFWIRHPADLPYWTKSSPFRTLFHWWMEKNGGQLIHAAAVGGPGGAVLITGKGGVGKSTTSLSCVMAGLHYVADDYLVVTLDPKPLAHSLYNTAKLNPDQAARFPELADMMIGGPPKKDEKAVMSLVPKRASQVVPALPLRAVLTPRFGSKPETEFAPIDTTVLQAAAAFTTLSQLPHSGRRTVEFINRMVERLPGLEMVLGHDVPRVPEAILRLLTLSDSQLDALAQRTVDKTPRRHTPLVSVIVPVYNGAHFLAEAVQSILAQNYRALEIIIVDDGSKDDIETAVAALPVDVRFFKQDNAGPAAARNRGIRDASGDYIAFLDVDDLWPENKLALALDQFEKRPELDVIQGYAQLMELSPQSNRYEYVGNPEESYPHYIGAALYRSHVFERVGLFDTTLRFGEDTDWYRRAKETGMVVDRLGRVTLFVRRHVGNMTRGKSLVELNALRVLKMAMDRKRAAAAADASAQPVADRP